MTHKMHSLLLLLFLLAFKTSFVSAASSEECPPNANSGSLCQQFKIAARVAPKTTVTGPTYLELKRVGDRIEGETGTFTITTNEAINMKYIAIKWGPNMAALSGAVGLLNKSGGANQNHCNIDRPLASGFPLDFKFKFNGGAYSNPMTNAQGARFGGMRIPMENTDTTATFNLRLESTHSFSTGLENLLPGATYGCNFELTIAPET